jgi:V/A-type H+-transporting ATPase subunit I
LVAVLGAAAFVCGTLLGTLFGIKLLEVQWQWFDTFKKFMINDEQLFNLALILGGVQIIFGMFVRAIGTVRRYGFAYSLATWGWIILFLGGGGLYLASEKTLLAPDLARYLTFAIVGIACLFIFILNTPKRNPLINIGAGLWNTYQIITGVLSDFLSYIRLFALGICGGVMGFVFNNLALHISGDIPVVSQLVMFLIFVGGHSLNIFISGLGAFAHPLRLTFVEFYKNAGFEGGGKKYKPLK